MFWCSAFAITLDNNNLFVILYIITIISFNLLASYKCSCFDKKMHMHNNVLVWADSSLLLSAL